MGLARMLPPALRSLLPHIGAQLTDLCSVATSDLPVMGATLGMMTRSFRMRMEHARAIVPQRGRECTVMRKNRVDARPLPLGQAVIRPARGWQGLCQALAFAASVLLE